MQKPKTVLDLGCKKVSKNTRFTYSLDILAISSWPTVPCTVRGHPACEVKIIEISRTTNKLESEELYLSLKKANKEILRLYL